MAKMLPTILRNLGSKPATRGYPYQVREPFQRTRGNLTIDLENCTLCTLCEKRCPTGAIKIQRKDGLWSFEDTRCIVCEACVEACPKGCLNAGTAWRKPVIEKGRQEWKVEVKKKEKSEGETS